MASSRLTQLFVAAGGRILRTRWIVRLPIAIYKARLGVVFGSRLLMLEHVGRQSGYPRYVVLEVVERPRPGSFIVASGFGTSAQWYRNVCVNPHVRVWVGRRAPQSAQAHLLPAEESAVTLSRYAKCHPRSWAALRPLFENTLDRHIDLDRPDVPLVRLDMTTLFRR